MFSSRSDQGIEPKQFSQIKFTIIQTTQPMSRYPTRKTIVFLAAFISTVNDQRAELCVGKVVFTSSHLMSGDFGQVC